MSTSWTDLINRYWIQYSKENPVAHKIHQLLLDHGEAEIINDHIAMRTLDDPRVNLDQMASAFKAVGYVEKNDYHFKIKKLYAKHFEHPDPKAPKVFISQLLLNEFSDTLQSTLKACLDQTDDTLFASNEWIYSGTPWLPISHNVYQSLLDESEYAAWLYAYGYRANHFTVSVNHLKTLPDLQSLNTLLKQSGFVLNTSGGEIKGTPDDLLEQSSTMAEHQVVHFEEGNFDIPSCYYEFARRYPKADGTLYSGFVAQSADKLFESTNVK